MSASDPGLLSRKTLLEYFLRAARPREDWQVGMELEKMGRAASDGSPIPYAGPAQSVRAVLEFIQEQRGGMPIMEADHLIGLEGPWGTITLEPGGQVEWSSRPEATLDALQHELEHHLAVMRRAGQALALRWLPEAVDPEVPLEKMPWMPKARYNIMRPFLGARGRLAHRMMTQSAAIQCAFDYADPDDWRDKFRAAATLSPVAVALFANSPRIDGRETGHVSYRVPIWRETDPARCGLPPIVFDPGFDLGAWLDWILDVPTMFRHRARGLVPAGGVPFRRLLERTGCDAVRTEDWETHISTIFTEVRSYTYIEVRSADLQPDELAFSVPALWTGLLYHPDALQAALELGAGVDSHDVWRAAMDSAARVGLDGESAGRSIRDLAREMLAISRDGLRGGAACAGDGVSASAALERLAAAHDLALP